MNAIGMMLFIAAQGPDRAGVDTGKVLSVGQGDNRIDVGRKRVPTVSLRLCGPRVGSRAVYV